jgi:AraC-like DNA-binding protein
LTDPKESARLALRAPHDAEPPTRLVFGLVALPALIRRLGGDPDAIFTAAGLDPRDFADPSNRIPYRPLLRVLNDAAARTGCPHFGLLAGRTWQLASMGVVGEIVRHSPTVALALQELVTRQHLNAEGTLAFLLHRNGFVDLGYAIYTPFTESTVQLYDAALAVSLNIMRELCGPGWNPTEVFLPHSPPAEVAPFQQLFRSRLRFDSQFSAIRFPATWMAQSVPGAEPSRLRSARAEADAAGNATLLDAVHRSLRTLLLHGKGSGSDVAQALAMHRRTLNRRLRDQGTTFQQVLDRVRFAVAKELLEDAAIPLPRIAAALGYSEAASFVRAFRRWTGTTPRAWIGSPERLT